MRSSIVNINPLVAFFVLAALFFAERARTAATGHPRRDAALAGAMAGLAAATKYPAALVCLAVALAILLAAVALAGEAAASSSPARPPPRPSSSPCRPCPAPGNVLRRRAGDVPVYGTQEIGSYWDQAVHRAEWDLPLPHPEVGFVFLRSRRRGSPWACGTAAGRARPGGGSSSPRPPGCWWRPTSSGPSATSSPLSPWPAC